MTHGRRSRPSLDGVLREQAGGDHHERVRRVRARGDRGDHDGAVVEVDDLAVELALDAGRPQRVRRPPARPPPTARPRPPRLPDRSAPAGRSPGTTRRSPRRLVAVVDPEARQRLVERPLGGGERDRGPAVAAGRRATARRRRGRARRPASTSRARPGRARAGSPCSTPRRARRAPRCGRSAADSGASPRRRGRSRTSRRTRATCSRSSPGRRAAAP